MGRQGMVSRDMVGKDMVSVVNNVACKHNVKYLSSQKPKAWQSQSPNPNLTIDV